MKNQYIGVELYKGGGVGQFADLKGAMERKTGVVLQSTLCCAAAIAYRNHFFQFVLTEYIFCILSEV